MLLHPYFLYVGAETRVDAIDSQTIFPLSASIQDQSVQVLHQHHKFNTCRARATTAARHGVEIRSCFFLFNSSLCSLDLVQSLDDIVQGESSVEPPENTKTQVP